MLFFDYEVFKYDWFVVAIDPIKGTETVIVNDKDALIKLYEEYRHDIWVGYNCRGYDVYIQKAIMLGFDPKTVNDWIIVKGRKGWEYSSLFNRIPLTFYDTMPNPPVSLKTLEGFMGNNIHETSVDFNIDRKLTPTELTESIDYCRSDVLNTIDVFLRRKNEFDSHMDLVKTFNLPLAHLGKTQAQLAAIILGAKRVKLKDEWEIRLPECLNLGKYHRVGTWFLDEVSHNYEAKLETTIAGVPHTIAWGGLHGAIPKYTYECMSDEVFIMADVDQLYPTIMVKYHLLSRAVAEPERFEKILSESLRLKALKMKKQREPYKRICNITYGAEGDKFNPMYDPLHRNLVCVYGQVLMIDLIDKIEGFCQLIQSNTDGILIKIKRKDIPRLKDEIKKWEDRTQLHMSMDEYLCVYQKDVNNYVIVASDGSYKTKGAYVKELSDLDYDLPIVNEAIKKYLLDGISPSITVYECTDLRKFQKIVKLSSKYDWVEHEFGYDPWYGKRGKLNVRYRTTVKYYNKAYRVFASKDLNDGRLMKCKMVNGQKKSGKFANTPDHCFTLNGDIKNTPIPQKLDKQWYVNLAIKRLKEFGMRLR